jgi:hypothetical protein
MDSQGIGRPEDIAAQWGQPHGRRDGDCRFPCENFKPGVLRSIEIELSHQ